MRVALFATCLADSFFAESALAAARVLNALGVKVVVPPAQTCCGQPAFNAGHHDSARRMARHTIDVFRDVDAVVMPSGSCAAMVRLHYGRLLDGNGAASTSDPAAGAVAQLSQRTWELTRFITEVLGVTELGAGLRGTTVAYHHGCHALRELRIHDEPVTLLRNAGATIVDWSAAEECCGFGGVFAVKMPEVSLAMADRKIDTLLEASERDAERPVPLPVDVLTSTDGGCLLQLAGRLQHRGIALRVRHIADLLWKAMDESPDAAVRAASRPGSTNPRLS